MREEQVGDRFEGNGYYLRKPCFFFISEQQRFNRSYALSMLQKMNSTSAKFLRKIRSLSPHDPIKGSFYGHLVDSREKGRVLRTPVNFIFNARMLNSPNHFKLELHRSLASVSREEDLVILFMSSMTHFCHHRTARDPK